MKLRSSITATVEAPLPGEILVPTERASDSFDFLALPEEIRMCVYRLCLISTDEISLDEGHNAYYVLNYSNDHPSTISALVVALGLLPSPARKPIQVHVPTNFVYPQTTNALVNFVPPATGSYPSTNPYPQVIPIANVDQSADLSDFPKAPASSKTGFQLSAGVYIGPIHTDEFSYLSPCTHTPFMHFNARLLQTCKTIYAEALPILYSKNRFVLHSTVGVEHFFKRFVGPPLTHLVDLRLEVSNLNNMLDAGGSSSLWSTILRQCEQLRRLRLSFRDIYWYESVDYIKSVIRVAANVADIKKGTGEPKMIMRAVLEDVTATTNILHVIGNVTSEIQHTMAKKTHAKIQLPRGPVVELAGRVSKQQLLLVQSYTRKGWSFKRNSLRNNCEIEPGAWVELEWVKNQG